MGVEGGQVRAPPPGASVPPRAAGPSAFADAVKNQLRASSPSPGAPTPEARLVPEVVPNAWKIPRGKAAAEGREVSAGAQPPPSEDACGARTKPDPPAARSPAAPAPAPARSAWAKGNPWTAAPPRSPSREPEPQPAEPRPAAQPASECSSSSSGEGPRTSSATCPTAEGGHAPDEAAPGNIEKFIDAVVPVLEVPRPPSASAGASGMEAGTQEGGPESRLLREARLRDVWSWFALPSTYGVCCELTDDEAYFVPFLSAIQLCVPRQPGASSKPMAEAGVDHRAGASEGAAAAHPGTTEPGAAPPPTRSEPVSEAAPVLKFEFFEGDPPPQRMPFSDRVRMLHDRHGRDGFEEDTLLRELHPRSWFAVAWYPIYRIPDRPLRARFLTFHPLHPPESQLLRREGPSGERRFALPVLGCVSSNAIAEGWLRSDGALNEPSYSSAAHLNAKSVIADRMRQKLRSLELSAATVARTGLDGRERRAHSDFEWFASRSK
eukprot:scaffold1644_cov357-Prasinococcus_capsulatus_cf.AAC.2